MKLNDIILVLAAAAVAGAIAFLPFPSGAQTANSNAGAASNASAGAAAGSSSGAVIQQPITIDQRSTPTNSGNVNTYNPNDLTIRNVPGVTPPSVIGGNPCSVGASLGGSIVGFGVGGGVSWADKECAERQRIALLQNMGLGRVANELACDDRQTYDAAKRSGVAMCLPRPAWDGPAAAQQPVAQPAPAPQPVRVAFNASQYPSASECLNAASAAGAPLSACAGKR